MATPDRILEIQGLLHQLKMLTRDIGDDISVEETVSLGREMWKLVDIAQKAASLCKDHLREVAPSQPGHYEFSGFGHTYGLVIVPNPTPDHPMPPRVSFRER